MSAKNLSIVSYLTIIGWAFSFSIFRKEEKKPLLQYHLKQSFGLILLSVLYGIIVKVVAFASSDVAGILVWFGIIFFILSVLGIINALNETQKPVPLIGKWFENKFAFIK